VRDNVSFQAPSRSLQFTAINIAAEVEPAQTSRATTLVSVNQQLTISAGVAVGAFSVVSTMLYHHVTELDAAMFGLAFVQMPDLPHS